MRGRIPDLSLSFFTVLQCVGGLDLCGRVGPNSMNGANKHTNRQRGSKHYPCQAEAEANIVLHNYQDER